MFEIVMFITRWLKRIVQVYLVLLIAMGLFNNHQSRQPPSVAQINSERLSQACQARQIAEIDTRLYDNGPKQRAAEIASAQVNLDALRKELQIYTTCDSPLSGPRNHKYF